MHFTYDNFCRVHKSLLCTLAMEAGITGYIREFKICSHKMLNYRELLSVRSNVYSAASNYHEAAREYFAAWGDLELGGKLRESGEAYNVALTEMIDYLMTVESDEDLTKELGRMRRFRRLLIREISLIE